MRPPRRLATLLLLAALASAALAGCGLSGAGSPGTAQPTAGAGPSPESTAAPTAAAVTPAPATAVPSPAASPSLAVAASPSPAATVAVRIMDFRFDPPTVTVAPGTTVVWMNLGPTDHTTTSKQGLWDSRILHAGQTFRFTFRQPGTYPYWCSLHPEMLGTVVVR